MGPRWRMPPVGGTDEGVDIAEKGRYGGGEKGSRETRTRTRIDISLICFGMLTVGVRNLTKRSALVLVTLLV